MPCCAVAGCTSHPNHAKERKLSFYRFPNDPTLHKQWVHFCKRKDVFNSKLARICSEHFLPSDFERDLQSELLGLPRKHLLRKGTVPSSYRDTTIRVTTRPLKTRHRNPKEENLGRDAELLTIKPTRALAQTLGHVAAHKSIEEDRHPSKQNATLHLQPDDCVYRETFCEWIAEQDSKNIHRMEEEVTIKCEPKWSSEDSNLEDENNEEHELVPQVWVKQEIKQEPDEQEENMSDLLNEIKEIKQEPDEQEENMPDPVNECLAENENVEDGEEKKDEDATELHDVMPECETVLEEELSVSDMQLPLEIIWKEPTDIQNGIHKCQICAKVFTKKYSLQDHLKVHGEKNFQCEVCLKLFSHRSTLNKHKFVHCAERRFSCPTCGKAFKTKDNLQRHIVGHRGERNYPCSVCNKLFMHRSTLATHLETHTGDKRFQCAVCFKRFSQRTTLINHERLHTREIPYKCHMCEKGFYRRCYLVRHLRDRHQINPSTSQPFKELPTPRLDEIYTTRD